MSTLKSFSEATKKARLILEDAATVTQLTEPTEYSSPTVVLATPTRNYNMAQLILELRTKTDPEAVVVQLPNKDIQITTSVPSRTTFPLQLLGFTNIRIGVPESKSLTKAEKYLKSIKGIKEDLAGLSDLGKIPSSVENGQVASASNTITDMDKATAVINAIGQANTEQQLNTIDLILRDAHIKMEDIESPDWLMQNANGKLDSIYSALVGMQSPPIGESKRKRKY